MKIFNEFSTMPVILTNYAINYTLYTIQYTLYVHCRVYSVYHTTLYTLNVKV